jgi:hypothetical protein
MVGQSAIVSGTPTQAGTFTFSVFATDAVSNKGSQSYTVTITGAGSTPIVISPTTLPNGTVGVAYSQTVTAAGGVPPYKGSTTGTLPPGLTVAALMSGVSASVAGTPTQAGTFTFSVIATDSQSSQGSQAYTVTIQTAGPTVPPINVGPPSLPAFVVGQPVQVPLTVSGGDGGPYTFAIVAGALPPGLSMSTAGVISGTPTTAGPYSFTASAADTSGNSGARIYTATVSATPVPVLPWWVLAALAYFGIRLAASRLRHRTT